MESLTVAYLGNSPSYTQTIIDSPVADLGAHIYELDTDFTTDIDYNNNTRQYSIADVDDKNESISKIFDGQSFDIIITGVFSTILSEDNVKKADEALNLHNGLLPRYRGRHPIEWAVIQDEEYVGVTIHQLDPAIDAGAIVDQQRIKVDKLDDIYTIKVKLTAAGCELLDGVLKKFYHTGKIESEPQNEALAEYQPPRTPADSEITWTDSSDTICRLVQMMKEDYAAFTTYNDRIVEFYDVVPFDDYDLSTLSNVRPGRVVARIKGCPIVTTGSGAIIVRSYDVYADTDSSADVAPGDLFTDSSSR